MLRPVQLSTALIFLLVLTGLPSSAFSKKAQTPQTVFLDSADGRATPAYQKILTAKPKQAERAKWVYLIERVRKSPHAFVRNSETFTGQKAASHFLWKSSKRGGVKTAKQFIDKVASDSFSSGHPYLFKISEKETYPLRDVLENELSRLESYLQEKGDKQP